MENSELASCKKAMRSSQLLSNCSQQLQRQMAKEFSNSPIRTQVTVEQATNMAVRNDFVCNIALWREVSAKLA